MKEIISLPGSDVHGETCKLIFGIDEQAPDWKSKRDIAKRITFGTIYGAGARKLAETARLETGIDISEKLMRRMIDSYKDAFPEFFRFMADAERECRKRGFVTLISGKRRYFSFGPPMYEDPRTAFNATIQGGLAETMRDVMIAVEKALPGTLLLQIHDSLVLEIPHRTPAGATDADWATTAREIMINTYEKQYGVPFQAEAARWEDKQ
jgi:DNA polymerase-1